MPSDLTAPETPEEDEDFRGAIVLNGAKATPRKSIVICGLSRSGTSFAASVFSRLGIPYWQTHPREISKRYEHKALRAAFQGRHFDRIREIATAFSQAYPVWSWKFPAIHVEFDRIGACVPNPHFVIIFKEPLSVAVRKNSTKGTDVMIKLEQVIDVYQSLARLAETAAYPTLLISYDRAMADLTGFLPFAAAYCGVTRYDAQAVIARIAEDHGTYLGKLRPPASDKAPSRQVAGRQTHLLSL